MAKARAVKAYRNTACLVAMEASKCRRPRWASAKATATFHFAKSRRRDRDNLLGSLKAAFDGIADAGVLRDDSGIIHMPPVVVISPNNPRVEIAIDRV